MKLQIGRRRLPAAAVVGATSLGLVFAPIGVPIAGAVTMAPAVEITMDSNNAGITAEGQTVGSPGKDYRIAGTKWCFGDKKTGQWIAVKLIDGTDVAGSPAVEMAPGHTAIPQPDGTTADLGARGVFAMVKASDDPSGEGNCTLDATVTLPSTENSKLNPENFKPGAEKRIALLAGSFGPKTGGGAPHAAALKLTIGEDAPAPAPASNRTVKLTGDRVQGLFGQYQSAYSAKTGKLYVTSVSTPAKAGETFTHGASTIAEVDPATMKVVRAAALPVVPAIPGAIRGVQDVSGLKMQIPGYGIAVDDARNLIWVTETRNSGVAAYDLSSFEQVWQSAPGAVAHSREVLVTAAGDVIVGGTGGLSKVSGERGQFTVAPFGPTGATEYNIVMNTVESDGLLYSADTANNRIRVQDARTGAVTRDIALTGGSAAEGITHGNVDVDTSLGVVVAADQGKRDATLGSNVGAGIGFYTTDGAPLGRLDAGTQNLDVAVDQDQDVAYVGDFASGEIRVVDLAAAKKGTPAVIGLIKATASGGRGVNHLTVVNGTAFAVTKDGAYENITVPWGANTTTGERVNQAGKADSLIALRPTFSEKVFDAATDSTEAGQQAPYDLSATVLSPEVTAPEPTPTTSTPAPTTSTPAPTTSTPAPTTSTPAPTTSTPAPTTSTPAPTTSTPAPAGSLGDLGKLFSLQNLGLWSILGIGGFVSGLLGGLSGIPAMFAPLLQLFGPR